jgi:hypothetical protein
MFITAGESRVTRQFCKVELGPLKIVRQFLSLYFIEIEIKNFFLKTLGI